MHGIKDYNEVVASAKSALETFTPVIRQCLQEISKKVQPIEVFFRYNDFWSRYVTEAISNLMVLHFIIKEQFLNMEKLEEILKMPVNKTDQFHIAIEEYLHAIPSSISELSRFSMNRVTLNDFAMPVKINTFVKSMYANIQLLNLRNDSLRRKMDSVKYEVKRNEEIIFNLKIRNLLH
jgi:predicted translin family RNA/ssDNA-binding protein